MRTKPNTSRNARVAPTIDLNYDSLRFQIPTFALFSLALLPPSSKELSLIHLFLILRYYPFHHQPTPIVDLCIVTDTMQNATMHPC